MKKRLLLFLLPICAISFVNFVNAQRTATFFQKSYKLNTGATPDSSNTSFESITRTSDGGYAILGYHETRRNNGDILVERLDSLGRVVWSYTYGSDSIEAPAGIRQTPDGGFVISGWNTDVNFDKGDMFLLKLRPNGDLQWANAFGIAEDYEEAYDVEVLNNGNILVVGRAPFTAGGLLRGYALLIRGDGTPEDGLFLTQGLTSNLFCVDKTADGGAVAGGYALGSGGTSFDPLLVKYDTLGRVVWARRYNATGAQFGISVKQTLDRGYILAGQHGTDSPSFQGFYLMKTRTNGDTAWIKTYNTSNNVFERVRDIAISPDGGYMVTGEHFTRKDTVKTKSIFTGQDTSFVLDSYNFFLMKTDSLGNVLWAKSYGDSIKSEIPYRMTRAANGGWTMAGETFGYGNAFGGGLLVHTDRDGNIGSANACNIKNITFNVGTFRITDSTRFVSTSGGGEAIFSIRRQNYATLVNDICQGTGLFTSLQNAILPDNAVKIFPNPAQETINLSMELSAEGKKATVKMFDLMGRMVWQTQTQSDLLRIDTPQYARGIYLIRVEIDGRFLTKKIVLD